jgi:NAD(P)-dependent dehydrogenase (short-subunit alcohol dehydrogenase family)
MKQSSANHFSFEMLPQEFFKISTILIYCFLEFAANFWTNFRMAFLIPRHLGPLLNIFILFSSFYFIESKIFSFLISFGVFSLLNYFGNKTQPAKKEDQTGKLFVITGVAENGIGYFLARDVLLLNAEVVLACRNVEKTRKVAEKLTQETKNEKISVIQLDTSSMKSIKSFVKEFKLKHKKLDVLMNNAGISNDSDEKTEEGNDLGLTVNYLGVFCLTMDLLDLLRESEDGRVVNTSSIEHDEGIFLLSDWKGEKVSKSLVERVNGGLNLYRRSKLFLNMFSRELQLREDKISVFSFHPGKNTFEKSNIFKECLNFHFLLFRVFTEIWKKGFPSFVYFFIEFFLKLRMMNAEQGASTGVFLATNKIVPENKGRFFFKNQVFQEHPDVSDANKRKQLWNETMEIYKKIKV